MHSTAHSTAGERDDAAAWEVARPERPGRVAGVSMAGFRVPRAPAGGLRMVPHPAVMLVVEFGTSPSFVNDGAGRRQCGSLVAGPGFGFGGAVRAQGENVECVQVRLSPVVARTILGASLADLGGAMVTLDDVWGPEAFRIRERLDEILSWEDRFAATDAQLALFAGRYERRPPVDPEVAWAWHRIVGTRGLVRVDRLAAELGWSRKRLWSRFRSQLGVPPKRAAQLIRFDHAAHRLVAGHPPARVAADSGYTDQSHLHRDVMAFTGTTPTTLAAEPFLTIDPIAWPTPPLSPTRR